MNSELQNKIKELHGPILILGASGFVGANLMHLLTAVREDVFGTTSRIQAWRLESLKKSQVICVDLLAQGNIKQLLQQVKPATIFDCIAYGGYSFEQNTTKIYQTNILFKVNLLEELMQHKIHCYIHAGSSSEYGRNSNQPTENESPTPNSHYAVTKNAMASLIYFAGKNQGLCCANLRLYSAYGPWEDRSRLIPTLVAHGFNATLPPFVDADTSRDFVYVDDVCEAFIDTALNLKPEYYGESFNIGTGRKTTIRELAGIAKKLFNVQAEPIFSTMPARRWDLADWYANPTKANTILKWKARTSLEDGLLKTSAWYQQIPDQKRYENVSKQNALNPVYSVSAIVACYKDGQAIPFMVERLVKVFEKLAIDYEIILVNDNSPDNSEAVIQQISSQNPRVFGITHSRNFGSQAAFRSGMELATKNACVLLDGDLQDPPEIIEQFVAKWKEGYDVVYGIRVKREAPKYMQVAYKLFYHIFDWFSSIDIPHYAGDFSLMDKKVVRWLLKFQERDLFLRGLRAYVGFKQTGVEYIRPERMFGVTTNSLIKNFGWAKKGIFSFSRTPLDILTAIGAGLTVLATAIALFQIGMHLFFPSSAPKGITTLMLLIIFFGSFSILAISLVGEYIAKIFEEVKARPQYIRQSFIKNGEIHHIHDESILNTSFNKS